MCNARTLTAYTRLATQSRACKWQPPLPSPHAVQCAYTTHMTQTHTHVILVAYVRACVSALRFAHMPIAKLCTNMQFANRRTKMRRLCINTQQHKNSERQADRQRRGKTRQLWAHKSYINAVLHISRAICLRHSYALRPLQFSGLFICVLCVNCTIEMCQMMYHLCTAQRNLQLQTIHTNTQTHRRVIIIILQQSYANANAGTHRRTCALRFYSGHRQVFVCATCIIAAQLRGEAPQHREWACVYIICTIQLCTM